MMKQLLLNGLHKTSLLKLARAITENKLRILCYHGFSLDDEHLWQPGVFMRPQVFDMRMRYLSQHGFPVLRLEEALELIDKGGLPKSATVITMDDGWFSSKKIGHAICRAYNFPYTVYVSSYHCMKKSPVYNMFVRYLFWKTKVRHLEARDLFPGQSRNIDLHNEKVLLQTVEDTIKFGKKQLDNEQRSQLLVHLGNLLDVDAQGILHSRMLHLIDPVELKKLAKDGVDIQLHTHRHQLPPERESVRKEITDNRDFLSSLVESPLNNFCYPSGLYEKSHETWLKELNITSAATTQAGFNDKSTNKLLLNRFLDFDNYDQLLFEAEMNGVLEIARILRKKWHWKRFSLPVAKTRDT